VEEIVAGGRYRRITAPRDHIWVVSCDTTSVSYRTRSGLASAPVSRFRRMFTYDPKPVPKESGS
jgi:hypothetical protein